MSEKTRVGHKRKTDFNDGKNEVVLNKVHTPIKAKTQSKSEKKSKSAPQAAAVKKKVKQTIEANFAEGDEIMSMEVDAEQDLFLVEEETLSDNGGLNSQSSDCTQHSEASDRNNSCGRTLKAKVRSKVVKATAASKYIRMPLQKICDDLEDLSEGECSEEE